MSFLIRQIITRHPFLDGNKRTAYEVAKAFLRLNGWVFKPDEEEAFSNLILIANGSLKPQEIENWVGRNLRKASEK